LEKIGENASEFDILLAALKDGAIDSRTFHEMVRFKTNKRDTKKELIEDMIKFKQKFRKKDH